jgi:hypothetical protein
VSLGLFRLRGKPLLKRPPLASRQPRGVLRPFGEDKKRGRAEQHGGTKALDVFLRVRQALREPGTIIYALHDRVNGERRSPIGPWFGRFRPKQAGP